MSLLITLGAIFVLAAVFVWVHKTYSLDLAFLAVGGLLLIGAALIKLYIISKRPPPREAPLPDKLQNDALAAYIPESLARDPIIQRILREISENPVPATATAVTIGMLLSREYFDGD